VQESQRLEENVPSMPPPRQVERHHIASDDRVGRQLKRLAFRNDRDTRLSGREGVTVSAFRA
jgi:hypothetical protein